MERFWSKVNKSSDCWNWQGTIGHNGYGRFKLNKKMQRAHRVSWQITHGEIPTGLFVCHKCDNRKCVNPSHLFLGTVKDNAFDMIKKRRQLYGEKSTNRKLTLAAVKKIIAAYQNGEKQKNIAKKYGISVSNVSRITCGKTWIHKGSP